MKLFKFRPVSYVPTPTRKPHITRAFVAGMSRYYEWSCNGRPGSTISEAYRNWEKNGDEYFFSLSKSQ